MSNDTTSTPTSGGGDDDETPGECEACETDWSFRCAVCGGDFCGEHAATHRHPDAAPPTSQGGPAGGEAKPPVNYRKCDQPNCPRWKHADNFLCWGCWGTPEDEQTEQRKSETPDWTPPAAPPYPVREGTGERRDDWRFRHVLHVCETSAAPSLTNAETKALFAAYKQERAEVDRLRGVEGDLAASAASEKDWRDRYAKALHAFNEERARANDWHQIADLRSAALVAAEARALKAEARVADLEKGIDEVMATRDHYEEFIGQMAVDLGCEDEWTNLHTHLSCIPEAIAVALKAEGERDELKAPAFVACGWEGVGDVSGERGKCTLPKSLCKGNHRHNDEDLLEATE